MLGSLYLKLFQSKFGEKYLECKVGDGEMDWTEKGMRRFFLLNSVVFFTLFFSLFTVWIGFQWRYLLSIVILSLYMVEKSSDTLVAVFEDLDKVNFEADDSDVRDSNRYKYLKRALNGEEIFK